MEKAIKYILFLHLYLISALTMGQTIGLRIPDTTVVEGQVINIPVYVDSTLTNNGVYSYQLEIQYSSYYLNAISANGTDAIAGQFGSITTNVSQDGKITLAGAGASPLIGKGVFLYIQFEVIENGGTSVNFNADINKSYFNEGLPLLNFNNAYFSISAAPEIYITPNSAALLLGDSLQMTVSGDTTSPFSYSVLMPEVGSISSSGMFYATAPGLTKVKVEDANGYTDETNSELEVYGFRLSSPSGLSEWQGSVVDIPVHTTNLTNLNITSGSFIFNYNTTILEFVEIITDTTLLDGATIEALDNENGTINIAFASGNIINGEGALMYIRFNISGLNTGYSSLSYSNILFNENLAGLSTSGQFQTINFADIYISPNYATLLAGDSIQITASNGVEPYSYSVSNPSIASISASGMLKANYGGIIQVIVSDLVGATKTSGNFTIYDTYVQIPDTTGPVGLSYKLPVFIGDLPQGVAVSSVETTVSFRTPELEFMGIVTEGTLSAGWSFAHSQNSNVLSIAGAGTSAINENGILFYLEFNLTEELNIGENAYIQLSDLLLNEGNPSAITYNGSITGTKSEDLGVSAIITPVSGCNLTNAEIVNVSINNYGYVNYPVGDTILVAYNVNNGTNYVDTIVLEAVFESGTSINHVFDSTIDLSIAGYYNLNAFTLLESAIDGNSSNDAITKLITAGSSPYLNLGEDISGCNGDTITIQVNDSYTSYEWFNGVTNSNSVVLTETSEVWLKVTNDFGCETSDTLQLTIYANPLTPEITSSTTSFCSGDTVILNAPIGYAEYVWSNGLTTPEIEVTDGGDYSLVVVDNNGCMSDTSAITTLTQNASPVASFVYVVNDLEVTFTNESEDASSYNWNFGDGNTSIETNPIHNYASAAYYTVELTASNTLCGSSTITRQIGLEGNQPPEIENQTFTLEENSPTGTFVGTIVASDSDGDALVYKLISGNTDEAFVLDSLTAELKVNYAVPVDYEINPTFNLNVEVSDSKVTTSAIITVNLINLDDDPNNAPVIANQVFSIPENSLYNTFVGNVIASDEDGDDLLFSIISGNTNDPFYIESISGTLRVNSSAALDYETTPIFSLTIQVSDGQDSTNAIVIVNLSNVDDTPNNSPVIANQTFSIAENSLYNAIVGNVVASDDDGDDIMFSILNGNTNNAFSIEKSTGIIRVNSSVALDYETTPIFNLTVQVSDGQDSTSATVTINLTDVDETNNTAPEIADQTFSVDENSPFFTLVGTVLATDIDEDILTYSISDGNVGNAFSIDETSGVIRVNNSSELDYETTPSFILTVQVSDNIVISSGSITINLNDIEETSNSTPVIADQSFNIAENSENETIIGTVIASDADGDALSFSIIEGNSNSTFAINSSTGVLNVNDSTLLDYETHPRFILAIEVFDGIATSSANITVNLTDVFENHAPVISDQSFELLENSINNTLVGTITASDVDNNTLYFKILNGNTGDAFYLNENTGILYVKTQDAIDFETNPIFYLEIEVSDHVDAASAQITINITDVFENSVPVIENQSFSLAENSANNTLVGTIVATDVDEDALVFTILNGNTGNAFLLNENSGVLYVNNSASIDFETIPTFSLEVEVTDNIDAATATITINITDINENRAPIIPNQTFSIEENSPFNTLVGQVVASDPDNDNLTFSILSGNTHSPFGIDATSGEIRVFNTLVIDYETITQFNLLISVSDGLLSSEATITVNVLDVDDGDGISDNTMENVNVFPNPNMGKFTLHFGESVTKGNFIIKVITLDGKIIQNESIENRFEQSHIIDISDRKSGIYILKIESEGSVKNLIIQKN